MNEHNESQPDTRLGEEREAPRVPDYALVCIQAYGDARADDDGTGALRLKEAITELRRWGAALSAPPASHAAQGGEAYLCRAWGETDLPCVTIARSRDEVREFYIREWLGGDNAKDYDGTPTLPRLMEEFDEHPWEDGEPITYEFEIGGVSVERVFA